MHIDFWFEFASTYSYPAAMRVEELASNAGIEVRWRPFLLGPIFAKQGWNDSPFNIYEAKGRYMWRDLERICESIEVPFRKPSAFPRNGLLAARVACAFQDEPWVGEFVRRVYTANFYEDRDIADQASIKAVLSALGRPADSILEQANRAESKSRLRDQTGEAQRLGIFGAPSFTVEGELFWGNDRLEDAIRWCQRLSR